MTAIEIFKTIALVAGILIAPFIIAALVCVLVVVLGLIISLIISLLRFLFTIEVDDADRQKRQAEDEEQIKYLQEYNRKKREGKK